MRGDRESIKQRLATVNYYRLSAYWHPFRLPDPTAPAHKKPTPRLDDVMPGTTFDEVWDRYVFDQKLKLIVMEAIERIEVAIRTQLAYRHAHAWTPDAYVTNPASLPRLLGKPHDLPSHRDFCEKIKNARRKAKDQAFIKHFEAKYTGSPHLPIWVATEIMSFGEVVMMFSGCRDEDQSPVSSYFGVTNPVLVSWLNTLQNVRNICAHHSRLWNRKLVKLPRLPARGTHVSWYAPVSFGNDRIFVFLTVCAYMLNVISATTWPQRVTSLVVNEYPQIPLDEMGFPSNWQQVPLWSSPAGRPPPSVAARPPP
jgi:abortive infection bacteriophage resistance protein